MTAHLASKLEIFRVLDLTGVHLLTVHFSLSYVSLCADRHVTYVHACEQRASRASLTS